MQKISKEEFDHRKVLKQQNHHQSHQLQQQHDHHHHHQHQQLLRTRRKLTRHPKGKENFVQYIGEIPSSLPASSSSAPSISSSYSWNHLKIDFVNRTAVSDVKNDIIIGQAEHKQCCYINEHQQQQDQRQITALCSINRTIATNRMDEDDTSEFQTRSTSKKKSKKWSSKLNEMFRQHEHLEKTRDDDRTSIVLKKHMKIPTRQLRNISMNNGPVGDQGSCSLLTTSEMLDISTIPTISTASTALISAKPTTISLKHHRHHQHVDDDDDIIISSSSNIDKRTRKSCHHQFYHHRERHQKSCYELYPFYGQQNGSSAIGGQPCGSGGGVLRKHCNYCICMTSDLASSPVWMMRALKKGFSVISGENHQIFSTTTTSKSRPINVFNVFLFIVILLNLTRLACGHNVNLKSSNISSDRVIPTIQQQQQHQFHINQQAEEQTTTNNNNKNNIRRGLNLNSPLTNLGNNGNSFPTLDDDSNSRTIDERSLRFDLNDNIQTNHHPHHRNDNDRTTNHNGNNGGRGGGDVGGSDVNFERASGCHSCQMHEKVKADNLASIKRHILYRLKLTDIPNITAPVAVPPEIIENFYKNYKNPGYASSNSNFNNRYGGDNSNGDSGGGVGNTSGERYSTYDDDMQGDDPRAYYDTNSDSETTRSDHNYGGRQSSHNHYSRFGESGNSGGAGGGGDDEDYEDGFFSVVNSIYIFPTTQHTRHNRKTDILHFPVTNNGRSTVSQATLHLFIRSWNWVREHSATIDAPATTTTTRTGSGTSAQSQNSNAATANRNLDIVLRINSVLRHANLTHTQKGNELRHRIPRNDNGIWITIDVTDMVSEWYNNASTNHGIVIETKEPWMKHLVVVDDSMANKTYTPYIEVITKDNRKRRTKRNTSLNCSEKDNEIRCCRYPLEVNFRHFNWDWVIAPEKFPAYFCNGECKIGFLQKYPHTHMMQMSTAPQPCCSPTKMSPVTLLYFNQEHHLVMSTIPNMAVDTCSCS